MMHGAFTVTCRSANGAQRWRRRVRNLVTTQGKNALLDLALSRATSYTAQSYLGLIAGTNYVSAPVVGDTMASHAGWAEAGVSNAPTTTANRPSVAWAATDAEGSKTFTDDATITIGATGGTVRGLFLAFNGASATRENTAGVLLSAAVFDTPVTVAAGDVLTISYALGRVTAPAETIVISGTLPSGVRSSTYSSSALSASGGTAPYQWSATGLPTGLTMAQSTGVVSGTPTTAASYSVTITVIDAIDVSAQKTQTITIALPPSGDADVDWLYRSGQNPSYPQPGVFRRFSFDDASQIQNMIGQLYYQRPFGILPGDDPGPPYVLYGGGPYLDTAVKVSGTSSMRFDIVPGVGPGGNQFGAWFCNFADDNSIQMEDGDEFWVQWRQRFTSSIIDTVFYRDHLVSANESRWIPVLTGACYTPGYNPGDYPAFAAITATWYQMTWVVETQRYDIGSAVYAPITVINATTFEVSDVAWWAGTSSGGGWAGLNGVRFEDASLNHVAYGMITSGGYVAGNKARINFILTQGSLTNAVYVTQGQTQQGLKTIDFAQGDDPVRGRQGDTNMNNKLVMIGNDYRELTMYNGIYSEPVTAGSSLQNVDFVCPAANLGTIGADGKLIPDPRAAVWVADEWLTLKVHVKTPTYANPEHTAYNDDGEIQCWIAREGEASKCWLDHSPGMAGYPGYWTGIGGISAAGLAYSKFWIFPWFTSFDMHQEFTPGSTWYDEVILSTQDIPDPALSTPTTTLTWAPDPGYYIDIAGANTMRDAAGPDQNQYQMLADVLRAWNASIFATDVGPGGALINYGSGHATFHDAPYGQVLGLTMEDTRWWQLRPLSVCPDQFTGDDMAGDITGAINAPILDRPGPPHVYNNIVYIPAAGFGNSKGALCLPSLGAIGWTGGTCKYWTWFLDLDNAGTASPCLWTKSTNGTASPPGAAPTYPCAAYDSVRNVVWRFPQGSWNQMARLDVASRTWSLVTMNGTYAQMFGETNCGYCPDLDCIAIWDAMADPSSKLDIWKPIGDGSSGLFYMGVPTVGTPPPQNYNAGMVWCPHPNVRKFYGMRYLWSLGYTAPVALTLTPPASLLDDVGNPNAWTWGSETFVAQDGAGPIGNESSTNPRYNSMCWVPAANSFIWACSTTGPTNMLRPAAAI